MANILGRSLPVERHDLQLPLNRNRSWQKANLAVAGLILELPRNRDCLSLRPQRIAELRRSVYLQILADPEVPSNTGTRSLIAGR